MSTLLELLGLAALVVGVFILLGTSFGLVVLGAVLFLYAQTIDDARIAKASKLSLPRIRRS
jgi:hypothetical protein